MTRCCCDHASAVVSTSHWTSAAADAVVDCMFCDHPSVCCCWQCGSVAAAGLPALPLLLLLQVPAADFRAWTLLLPTAADVWLQ